MVRTKKYNAKIGYYLVVSEEKFTAEQLIDKEEKGEEQEYCRITEEKSVSAPQAPYKDG